MAASTVADMANTTLPKGKPSPGGDSANCPLCQTGARGGDAILPVVITISAPVAAPNVVPTVANPRHVARLSHNWRGRAPPLA